MAPEQLGPYRIGRKLGRGGMGTVYEGVDTGSGQVAAIKVLATTLADEVGFRERFETEIETLKKLNHENIVRLLGWGEQDNQLYYAMELVPGTTLEEELGAGRRFHWREVTRFGIMLCRALRHAHDRGVIHRDIKPANLLLTPEGVIKLSDFGIARLFGNTRLTADGGLIGTAEYMAPEQADGRIVTLHCDLYSLGCVLYALLAGRPPFRSTSLPEMLQLQRFAEPPQLTRYAADVPEELAQIIHGLLEKDPQRRPHSATVLGRQLAATEFGLSMTARDETARDEASPNDVTRVAPIAGQDTPTRDEAYDPLGATRVVDTNRPIPQGVTAVHDQTTSDADPEIRIAPPQPTNRFTTLDEESRRTQRQDAESGFSWQTAGLAAGLLALVVAAYFAFRPPSADTLYAKITAVAAADDPERLREVEDEIASFLARFPNDERRAEVEGHRQQLEQYRLQKRLRRETPGAAVAKSPVEQAYLRAMQLADADPHVALRQLTAIVAIYDDPAAEAKDLDVSLGVVKQQIDKLNKQADEIVAKHKATVQKALDRAEKVAKSDPKAAAAIYQSIVTLYGERSWAEELVATARKRMNGLAVRST